MTTIERIKSALAENPRLTNSELAELVGVSRQRVSQLCRANGVTLRRAYPVRRTAHKPPKPPTPRVVTGGIQTDINHTVCGTISELLVSADLMARGYKPYTPIVRQRSHDIIAVNLSGEMISIEVRSGRRRADGAGITWQSKCERVGSDYYAIVITGEPVIYKPDLPNP